MKFRNMNWAPYLLLLPSFIYLMLFFAWPMVQALARLPPRQQILPLRAGLRLKTPPSPAAERGTTVMLDVMVVETQRAGGLLSDRVFWLKWRIDPEGERVSNWPCAAMCSWRTPAGRLEDGSLWRGRLRAGPALTLR